MHFGRTINKVLQTLPSPAESYNCIFLNHNSGFGFIPSFPLRYTQSHLERESRHLHHPNGPCLNSHRLSTVPVSQSPPLTRSVCLSLSVSPSFSLSGCLSLSPSLSLCLSMFVSLSLPLLLCLSVFQSPPLSLCLFLQSPPLSLCLSVSLSLPLFLSACRSLSVSPSCSAFLSLSVSPFVCLYQSPPLSLCLSLPSVQSSCSPGSVVPELVH